MDRKRYFNEIKKKKKNYSNINYFKSSIIIFLQNHQIYKIFKAILMKLITCSHRASTSCFVTQICLPHSNKTPNQLQQSIIKFIAYSHRRRSTCFRHYYVHHQEPFQTAVAASGFRMTAEVDVFSAVVGLLVTNKPTTAGNTTTSAFVRKPEAATAV
jgi:hypothetical protein